MSFTPDIARPLKSDNCSPISVPLTDYCRACVYNIQTKGQNSVRTPILHDSFADLERCALKGCLGCQFIRRIIVYNSAELWSLRQSQRPLYVYIPSAGPSTGKMLIECAYQRYQRDTELIHQAIELDFAEIRPQETRFVEDLKTQTSVTKVLTLASQCLKTCSSHHLQCLKFVNDVVKLPTRVIDVGSNNANQNLSLFITNGQKSQYCTLSYCWGGNNAITTTTANLTQHTQDISFTSLPKTIRDAVIITRHLGLKYLWVDALCILQDSKDDKEREIASMQDVYRQSCCTIAASASVHADEGILLPREAQKFSPTSNKYFGSWIAEPRPTRKRSLDAAPLNTRAWALQERLLSPRILHWTAHCFYWDCLTHSISELAASPSNELRGEMAVPLDEDVISESESFWKSKVSFHASLDTMSAKEAYQTWENIVLEYTSCDLTVEEDRLPALSGVASLIHHRIGGRYFAGLWENYFTDGLQWCIEPYSFRRTQPEQFIAPSWSWASAVARVSSPKMPWGKWKSNWEQEMWVTTLQIINVHALPRGENMFGKVLREDCRLSVCGSWRPLFELGRSPRMENGTITFVDVEPRHKDNLVWFDVLRELPSTLLYCLEVTHCVQHPDPVGDGRTGWQNYVSSHALVLQPTENENEYCRVGFAKLTNPDYFKGCERRIVSIV